MNMRPRLRFRQRWGSS